MPEPARMRDVVTAIILLLVITSCGGRSPTSPGGSSGIPFLVAVGVSGGGTFSATLNHQTYTAGHGFQASLPSGTYEMHGTYSGGTLIVGFASTTSTGGGVQAGSVQAVSGVVLGVQPCGIAYSEGGARDFRVRFAVGTHASNTCR